MSSLDFPFELTTAAGIPYHLISSSPSEDGEKAYNTEVYLMLVRDIPAFFAESFPQPVINAGFPTLAPRRTCPGTDYLVTAKVSFQTHDSSGRPIDPFGSDNRSAELTGAGGEPYSPFAQANIEYETGINNETDKEFLEKSFTAGGEYLYIPPQKIAVSENPPPADWQVVDP